MSPQRVLAIYVTMSDEEDFEWVRARCLPPVEDACDLMAEEGRLDGVVSVEWESLEEAPS